MKKLCIINAVGLTPAMLPATPQLAAVGEARAWQNPIPGVTCTSQATLLTGKPPSEHGIVGNGWYFRDTAEIRFWQQSRSLVQAPMFYERFRTAKMFWWFNQNSQATWGVTPKPHYGCDGSKAFGILDNTECSLEQKFGAFPFPAFWGPTAGLASTRWIANASAEVMRRHRPEITLVYLPHLDYDYQRFTKPSPERLIELDLCASTVIQAANEIDATVIVISEYGIVPVHRSIAINRVLRKEGLLCVRPGPYGEQLMPGESKAFAVVDHQIAHVYIRNHEHKESIRSLLESVDGIAQVVDPDAIELRHARSGELIALAEHDAWFNYYFWNEDRSAPDYARTLDIHRKPGYDPVELFMTSKTRAMFRLAQKKLGMRYRMDVIPLDPTLVKGSHGLHPAPEHGPLVIGPSPPSSMTEFAAYAVDLMSNT